MSKTDRNSVVNLWHFFSLIFVLLSIALVTGIFPPIVFQAGSRNIDLEVTTLSSTNHVELTPSDAGFQDRYIVQEIIKEMAKNRPIDTKGKKGYKGDFGILFLKCHTFLIMKYVFKIKSINF